MVSCPMLRQHLSSMPPSIPPLLYLVVLLSYLTVTAVVPPVTTDQDERACGAYNKGRVRILRASKPLPGP